MILCGVSNWRWSPAVMEPIIFSHKLATINDFSGCGPPSRRLLYRQQHLQPHRPDSPKDRPIQLQVGSVLLWINWRAKKNAVKITPESKPGSSLYIYNYNWVQFYTLPAQPLGRVGPARGISREYLWKIPLKRSPLMIMLSVNRMHQTTISRFHKLLPVHPSSSDTIHRGIIIVVTRGSHTTQHGHRYTGRPFDLGCAVSIANMYLDKGGQ